MSKALPTNDFGGEPRTAKEALRLLALLVRWDLRERVAGAWLGLGWTVIQPFFRLATYGLLFLVILRSKPSGAYSAEPAMLWMVAGFLPWLWFADVLGRAPQLIWDRQALVRSQPYPVSLLAPMNTLSAGVYHLVALALMALVLQGLGRAAAIQWGWLALQVFWTGALATGIGWIFCCVGVYVRDLPQAVILLLNVWAYATPLGYPLEIVPPSLQPWILANPLTGLAEGYRAALLGHPLSLASQLGLLLWCGALLALGWLVLVSLSPRLRERL